MPCHGIIDRGSNLPREQRLQITLCDSVFALSLGMQVCYRDGVCVCVHKMLKAGETEKRRDKEWQREQRDGTVRRLGLWAIKEVHRCPITMTGRQRGGETKMNCLLRNRIQVLIYSSPHLLYYLPFKRLPEILDHPQSYLSSYDIRLFKMLMWQKIWNTRGSKLTSMTHNIRSFQGRVYNRDRIMLI